MIVQTKHSRPFVLAGGARPRPRQPARRPALTAASAWSSRVLAYCVCSGIGSVSGSSRSSLSHRSVGARGGDRPGVCSRVPVLWPFPEVRAAGRTWGLCPELEPVSSVPEARLSSRSPAQPQGPERATPPGPWELRAGPEGARCGDRLRSPVSPLCGTSASPSRTRPVAATSASLPPGVWRAG